MPQLQEQGQPLELKTSLQQKDSPLADYPEFIRKPAAVSDDDIDMLFVSAGFESSKEEKRTAAIKTVDDKLAQEEQNFGKNVKPSPGAEAIGVAEPIKVAVGAAQQFGNLVADGVRTAYDFISNMGRQSADFKSESSDFFGDPVEPDTAAGRATKQLAVHLAPLAIGGPIAGVGRSVIAGGVIDFLGTDPNQDRLSNLVQEVPWLRNPIAAALSREPGETQLKSRVMNTLEGVLTMGLGYGVFKAGAAGVEKLLPRKAARALVESTELNKVAKEILTPTSATDIAKKLKLAEKVVGKTKPVPKAVDKFVAQLDPELPAFALDSAKVQSAKTIAELSDAVGINLEKLNTTDEVLQVVTDFAEKNKDLINKYRPTMTHAEAQEAGQLIYQNRDKLNKLIAKGLTPKDAEDTLAAQVVAHKMLTQATANEMVKSAKAAVENITPEGLIAYRDARDKFGLVFTSMRNKQTEIAVAQSAGRIIVDAGIPLGERAKFFDEAVRLSGGEKNIVEEAKKIKLISEMPDAAFATNGMGEIQKASGFMKFSHALSFYTLNNILTLKSLGNATAGNVINMVVKDVGLLSGAAIGEFRKLTTGAGDALTFKDAYREIYGQVEALKEAFVNVGKSLKTGQSIIPDGQIVRMDTPYNVRNPMQAESLFGIDSNKNLLAKIYNNGIVAPLSIPTRLIIPADSFFGTLAYRGRQKANGLRLADELKIAPDKVDEFMTQYMSKTIDTEAIKHAEDITLSGNNIFSDFVSTNVPIAKVVFPVMRTEVNGMKFIFEHSPFMLATSKARSATGREADLIYGGVAAGVMGVGTLAAMAHFGQVTGSVPQNYALEKALREAHKGWQPNSVVINGKYIPVEKFGIMGAMLRLGTFINDARNYIDDHEYEQLLVAAGSAVIDAHTTQSYMENIGDFFTALSDVAAAGDDKVKANALWADLTKRFQPLGGIQNQIAREIDPVLPSNIVYTDGMGKIEAFIEKASMILKGRTPFLSKDVPPQVNFFGEAVYAPSGWFPFVGEGGTATNLMSPFAVHIGDNSDLVRELKDLAGFSEHMAPYDEDMPVLNIKMPTNVIPNEYDKVGFQLTAEEYYKFMVRSAGKDPDTGEVVSPNGKDLRETMTEILGVLGKKEVAEIYKMKHGHLAVKSVISKLQGAILKYRKQGRDYLFNTAKVQDRMKKEFEARSKKGAM